MKATWLIELDLFLDTEKDMIKAIKDSGREVKTVEYVPTDDKLPAKCKNMFTPEECVVFYGSLNLGKKLKVLPNKEDKTITII
jgi:hypothetical protein